MFRQFFAYIIYSNLFIACCAVLMTDQTFHFLLQSNTNIYLVVFTFFSTICSYSFHWYLTAGSVTPSHRLEWLAANKQVHLVLFIIGLLGSGIFFFYLTPYWPWLLIAAVATFLYSAPKIPHPLFRALRKVAIGKTIFLAFVWMYVTTVLPIIVADQQWSIPCTLFVTGRFFLIYAICILFDYRDRADDKAAGIRSLITYLSERSIRWLFFISLAIFATSCLLLLQYDIKPIPVLLLLVPGIITACLYEYTRSRLNDMLYYFVLDGLMAFSGLLMLLARI